MQQLLKKAIDFISKDLSLDKRFLKEVYRTKDVTYWDQVKNFNKNVIYPEFKDNNGHIPSCINGRLSGIWFSAFVFRDGSLPRISPFGNKRYHVPSTELLNPNKVSFYFADFYCHTTGKQHYVTIVIATKNSGADKRMSTALPKLNPVSNPFITICWHRDGGFSVFSSGKVFIELYYLSPIDINTIKKGHFKMVRNIGTPIPWEGKPANPCCSICNM